MDEFKELENLWKQNETKVPTKKIDLIKIQSNRKKLIRKQLQGSILLALTGIFILILMINLHENLKTNLVYASMIIIAIVCFLQAALMFFTMQKMKNIDESQTPRLHLQQWQNFREFQKNQTRWNMPVYYALLGSAIGTYMFELLKKTETWIIVLAFALTYGWMFFAYFYLGKKALKKQNEKLNGIISELKSLENQFE